MWPMTPKTALSTLLLLAGVVLQILAAAARKAVHPPCSQTCGAAKQNLTYPFGFSPGCPIQLDCNKDGDALIGEFQLQSASSDTVTITIEAKCERPFRSINQLYGRNYAPVGKNSVLLNNCTKTSPCNVPNTQVIQAQFQSLCAPSNKANTSMSCYSEEMNNYSAKFLDRSRLDALGCEYFLSSMSAEALNNVSVSLGVQMLQLAWWVNGDECECSQDADCVHLSGLPNGGGGNGFRCKGREGFLGDGFLAGIGCRRGQQGDLVTKVAMAASGVGIAIVILVVYSFREKPLIRKHIALMMGKIELSVAAHQLALMMGKTELSTAAQQIEGLISSRRYTYKDIKRMTNSFQEKLGQGGYGCVYKGKLPNGQLVAVKLLKKLIGDGEEFINEVASISRTSHVNVVSLLGFCFEGSKRALVYEFMPNGSLEKFIFKSGTSEANQQLSWETLYSISEGIARGLEYLHRGCNARILHFDIKPHNILLNHNYCPKISDFGLAKICPGEESIVSMLGARGTAGYIAPELVIRNIGGVSHKSDVYSYGMMVLEMVSGRKNVEVGVGRSSEIYFPHWIHRRLELQEELGLRGITNEVDEGIVKKMIIISLWCIQIDPRVRPSMTQVVEMLKGSVEALQFPPKPTLSSPPSRSTIATTDESSLLQFDVTTTSV